MDELAIGQPIVAWLEVGQETGVICGFPSDDTVEYEADGIDEEEPPRRTVPRQRVSPA